jgi:hypothetical protein
MVEVFKTNVKKTPQARRLVSLLTLHFPASRINFDLQDCDKVLRVEGDDVAPAKIMGLVQGSGFACNVLE